MKRQEARQHILTAFGEEALKASPLADLPDAEPASKKAAGKKASAFDNVLRRVEPTNDNRFTTCLPLVELEAAAGAFSGEQTLEHGVLNEAPDCVR
jgi:hypothetical protein